MNRSIRRAIDAMPLSQLPETGHDHASHEVFDHCHFTPIKRFSPRLFSPFVDPHFETRTSADGMTHELNLIDCPRSVTGRSMKLRDLARHLLQTLSNPAKIYERFWLSHLHEIKLLNESLIFHLKSPDFSFLSWLGLYSLSQNNPFCSYAPYSIKGWSESQIYLQSNPNYSRNSSKTPPMEFFRIKDPWANLLSFRRGDIDRTSDTAFPFDAIDKESKSSHFRKYWPGIFFFLELGDALSTQQKKAISRIIQSQIPSLLKSSCPILKEYRRITPISLPLQFGTRIERTLTLVYDSYYPNAYIAERISKILRSHGIPVELIEDSFENPAHTGDLRLVLYKGYLGHELSIYDGLIFHRCFKKRSKLRNQFHYKLRHFRASHRIPQAPQASLEDLNLLKIELHQILEAAHGPIPLFEIPGIYLERS